ncbi:unnamed protein product [Bursaphelenchus xylophilus]|uniref:(pine wood nematode) hypothetical protein n=1 Tax=Bursaphelenchus xylophilus TaxID=6326 RepID=A0A7I8WJL7_BURXY|nr:unnamed protein product [Bursaphelenchus xylophilus]CAG9107808.1 unnamed protein product [Bursaphelenchus xylophilus]
MLSAVLKVGQGSAPDILTPFLGKRDHYDGIDATTNDFGNRPEVLVDSNYSADFELCGILTQSDDIFLEMSKFKIN